jgi:hypothetical protein
MTRARPVARATFSWCAPLQLIDQIRNAAEAEKLSIAQWLAAAAAYRITIGGRVGPVL